MGDGRHRTPHRRRQGVPGRGPRRLQPPSRGLVDRRPHPFRARRRRRPNGPLAAPAYQRARRWHSDHGSQYTSWAFGRRLRGAGLLGSMGSIGDCFDNSVAESFFGTLNSSYPTNRPGPTANSSPSLSSTGSKPGTTRAAGTPTAACSIPSTTRPPRRPPAARRGASCATTRRSAPPRTPGTRASVPPRSRARRGANPTRANRRDRC